MESMQNSMNSSDRVGGSLTETSGNGLEEGYLGNENSNSSSHKFSSKKKFLLK